MIFQKHPRCQESKHQITINNHVIEHSMSYTYLGITITASGSFNMAVNALKEKAQRALHTIKRKMYHFQIPVKICLKIFDSVIQPIALYGSQVWCPLSHQSRQTSNRIFTCRILQIHFTRTQKHTNKCM